VVGDNQKRHFLGKEVLPHGKMQAGVQDVSKQSQLKIMEDRVFACVYSKNAMVLLEPAELCVPASCCQIVIAATWLWHIVCGAWTSGPGWQWRGVNSLRRSCRAPAIDLVHNDHPVSRDCKPLKLGVCGANHVKASTSSSYTLYQRKLQTTQHHQHTAQQPNTTADEAQCKQDFGLHQLQQTYTQAKVLQHWQLLQQHPPKHLTISFSPAVVKTWWSHAKTAKIGIPQSSKGMSPLAKVIHFEICYTLNIVFNSLHWIDAALTAQLSCHGIELKSAPIQPTVQNGCIVMHDLRSSNNAKMVVVKSVLQMWNT